MISKLNKMRKSGKIYSTGNMILPKIEKSEMKYDNVKIDKVENGYIVIPNVNINQASFNGSVLVCNTFEQLINILRNKTIELPENQQEETPCTSAQQNQKKLISRE